MSLFKFNRFSLRNTAGGERNGIDRGLPIYKKMLLLMILSTACLYQGAALAIPTDPAGLNPGDQYRWLFVTSGATTATNTNLTYYDTFVTNCANDSGAGSCASGSVFAGSGLDWEPLVNVVNTTDLKTRLGYPDTIPIYVWDGTTAQLLAPNGTTGFFSATTGAITSAFYTENGATPPQNVWTGSKVNGDPQAQPLGDPISSSVGDNQNLTIGRWLLSAFVNTNTSFPLYALSETITIPGAAPVHSIMEGGRTTVLFLGLGLLLLLSRRATIGGRSFNF